MPKQKKLKLTSKSSAASGSFKVEVAGIGGDASVGDFGVAVSGIDAIYNTSPGSNSTAGNSGIAVSTHKGTSVAGVAGVAVAKKSGTAHAGAAGVATATDNGVTEAGDGGVAHISGYNGIAKVGNGVAFCAHGDVAEAAECGSAITGIGRAQASTYGLASVRGRGSASAGKGGIAIAWNQRREDNKKGKAKPVLGPCEDGADPSLGLVAAGAGGVIIAFLEDPKSGERTPVVGLTGRLLHPSMLQTDLEPGASYRLNAKTGLFEKAVSPNNKVAKF
jgi:hypothetical protein